MRDLNDLRVFERVAFLRSFSAAARALGMPKSSVSRGIARLESELGTRLFQRTTRDVELTAAVVTLQDRCSAILSRVDETMEFFNTLRGEPRGHLKVSAGIGFGINVLAYIIPSFLKRYPGIECSIDLSSRQVDLVAERVDVSIRLGPMPDSRLVTRRLGVLRRYLCAAPAYLASTSIPSRPDELAEHVQIEMPGTDGRPRTWQFTRDGITADVDLKPRVTVNDALAIHRLIQNGAGLGCVSGYLCAPDFAAGRLVRLLQEWTLPLVEVNAVFPSSKALSPVVRTFVDFLAASSVPGHSWQDEVGTG